MSMSDAEYRTRWNTINETKSLTAAADQLGLPYSTITKWYHDHREEFLESTRVAIKKNSGRTPNRSIKQRVAALANPLEEFVDEQWEQRPPDEIEVTELQAEGPRPAKDLVDALFLRFKQLSTDNERLFLENKRVREENARLKGQLSALADITTRPQRERLEALLEEATANANSAD